MEKPVRLLGKEIFCSLFILNHCTKKH